MDSPDREHQPQPWYRMTHLWAEFLSLLALAGCFFVAASAYPNLPERFPSHFDFRGVPDGWAQKSMLSVFAPALAAAGLLIIISVSQFACTRVSEIIKGRPRESVPPELDAAARREVIAGLALVKAAALAVFALLMWYSTRVALGQAQAVPQWVLPGVVVLPVLSTLRVALRTFRIKRLLDRRFPL